MPQEPQDCVKPIEDGDDAGEDKEGTMPASLNASKEAGPFLNGSKEAEPSAPKAVDLAVAGSSGTTPIDGASESPKHSDRHIENEIQRQHATSSAQDLIGDSVGAKGAAVGERETLEGTPVDAQALVAMRKELDTVKNSASGLAGALRESRSEVLQLREKLAMEEATSRRQAGKIASLR